MGKGLAWAVALGAALTGMNAQGQDGDEWEEGGWHLGVSAGAYFPVSTGLQTTLEMPFGLRASVGMGVVPGEFQDAVNDALISFNAYRPEVGTFVLNSIGQTAVRRGSLGWRPFKRAGFFVEGGYTQVTLNSGLDSSHMISAVVSPEPSSTSVGAYRLAMTTDLHMAHGQVGWEWTWDRLVLRAGVGGSFTVDAESDVNIRDASGNEYSAGVFENMFEEYVDSALERYGHTPMFTLNLGYRLF